MSGLFTERFQLPVRRWEDARLTQRMREKRRRRSAFSSLASSESAADLGLRKLWEKAFTGTDLTEEQPVWSITCLGSTYSQSSVSTGTDSRTPSDTKIQGCSSPLYKWHSVCI